MSGQLEVENLHAFYGTSHVLFGINLTVHPGECVCLLGRNGVGKTTTLKSIMGLVPVRDGWITYDGRNLAGLPPHEIARSGIGFAPDERLIFPDLTVRDNLEIAINPTTLLSDSQAEIPSVCADATGRRDGFYSGPN
jgi:branched-chain amino acid transport system ATP-binding protein